MSPDAILMQTALELKYAIDPATQEKISTIYTTVTGKKPKPATNLLPWFLKNFEFDGVDTWHHRERRLPN